MADKSIFELNLQTTFATNDRLVVGNYANSDAEAITGQTLINLLAVELDGHGGIQSITKTSSSGTNPVVDTYTITFADTSTTTFSVTNGVKGDTGAQTYVYFRYAHTEPSTWANTTDQPDNWMGVYAGTASPQPTSVSAYAWYEIKGEKGETGAASSITTQNVSYQTSSSGTVAPSGSWTTTIPTVPPGSFLWTRTQLAFNDGSVVTAYSVSRFGIDGTGSVSSVNQISPDGNGNVALTADDIPLTNNVSVEDTIDQIETDVGNVANLTTSASNCVDAINEVKTSLSTVKSDLGIVEDTNTATHTIAAGQYVIWKDALYIASAAIPLGTTLSLSNLTAVSGGGFNNLYKTETISGWTCRTAPDGLVECWKDVTATVSYTASGGAYRGSVRVDYPFSFSTYPLVLAVSEADGDGFWGYVVNVNNKEQVNKCVVTLERMSAASGSETIAVYLRGTRA